MVNKIDKFTISDKATVREALMVLNDNQFCIVIDLCNKVLGILTENIVGKALVEGIGIDDTIENVYINKFPYLCINESVENIIELLKDKTVNYIPIINDERKLLNVVTKEKLQAVLLQDKDLDLLDDFFDVCREVGDFEINQRPWGFYKTMGLNGYFQSKVISVKPYGQLSLQSHTCREEYWIVVHGTGLAQVDGKDIPLGVGDTVFIPKESKHRLINENAIDNLQIVEVQIGDYFGEDDIIRYEDIYGRV